MTPTAWDANLVLLVRAGDGRPRPLVYLLITVVGVSWSFVAAGLVAWMRRPANRTDALMVAVGLSYALLGLFFNAMVLVATPATFALWYLANSLPRTTCWCSATAVPPATRY